jgi:hypothetical protein
MYPYEPRDEFILFHHARGRKALRVRRPVGMVAREGCTRQGAGELHHHHHTFERALRAGARPHAADAGAGGFREMAGWPRRALGAARALRGGPVHRSLGEGGRHDHVAR